jgi:hypothetical protein
MPRRRTWRELTPRTPGIRELRVDHEKIYQALDQQRRYQDLRFIQIAVELGVAPATVTGWGHGAGLRADHLARVLAWLGNPPLSDFVTTESLEPARPSRARDDAA